MSRTSNDYKPILVAMMSYWDDTHYTHETTFSQERLLALTPADILRWLNFKTFGEEIPSLDTNPTSACCNSILHWKKAISSFMPNGLGTWNCANNSRNPTRSQELNDLVACVRKKETHLQGVASHARCPLTDGGYHHQHTILHESPEHGNITCYGVPAFKNFQCHMIACIDCVSQWQKVLFQPHDIYPEFAAKAQ